MLDGTPPVAGTADRSLSIIVAVMGGKTAVLHIGTHKTGNTSLQTMIAGNVRWFDDQGLYYPSAGRGSGDGHHNVAWELNGDERYDPAGGSTADLVLELEQVQAQSVLLSSEDFEYLYRRPANLARLRQALEQLGYAIRVLVVVRQPAEYVESLYSELRKHGLVESLDDFVDRALEEGGVVFGQWDFRVDYHQLLSGFAAVFGARVVHVLPYDSTNSVGSVLAASGRLLRLRLAPVHEWERWNARQSTPGTSVTNSSSIGDAPDRIGLTASRISLTAAERESIEATFSRSAGLAANGTGPRPFGRVARLGRFATDMRGSTDTSVGAVTTP